MALEQFLEVITSSEQLAMAFQSALLLLISIVVGLFLFLQTEQAAAEAVTNPTPITIRVTEGSSGLPKIPSVPRNEVICFALYTVEQGTLKLSAQLYPLQDNEPHQVTLEIKKDGQWRVIANSKVDKVGWLATFRIEKWENRHDIPYRVTHSGGAAFEGLIRKDPIDKDEIVVAAFTGNSNRDRSPRTDIIDNIKRLDPDLLFFSGDQSYDHEHHTAAWLLFGRQFRDIMRDRPTVTIPDDHDVGQGNLWGAGGKISHLPGGADGGYTMPADYVKMVERAQTSHLPDPYDPTPIEQGIGVYYTSLNVGGIDFAILEDRKWKSGPAGMIPPQGPRPDHINTPSYDRSKVDVPEARLLENRQLKFLDTWAQNWQGTEMKAVLSQTIFAGGAHIHGKHDARLLADLDSNGWPQSGRIRALHAMRRCYAFHIAGDQHLATVIHHGTQDWEDAGYSFCVPSIVNCYGRWWWPEEEPLKHAPNSPLPFTGRYFDGFGNKLTMQAYANPTDKNYNAAGFGLVRFKKPDRSITMECWPRHVDVSRPDAKQFAGWPITIHQQENYARKAIAWLPTLKITGKTNPVVQVRDESTGQVVSTLRLPSKTWRPRVFHEGTYTLRIGTGEKAKSIKGVPSTFDEKDDREIKIRIAP